MITNDLILLITWFSWLPVRVLESMFTNTSKISSVQLLCCIHQSNVLEDCLYNHAYRQLWFGVRILFLRTNWSHTPRAFHWSRQTKPIKLPHAKIYLHCVMKKKKGTWWYHVQILLGDPQERKRRVTHWTCTMCWSLCWSLHRPQGAQDSYEIDDHPHFIAEKSCGSERLTNLSETTQFYAGR